MRPGFFFAGDNKSPYVFAMPHTTKLSASLCLITGLLLLAGVLLAGFYGRSPWIILPLWLAFTVSFVIGRLKRWQLAIKQHGTHTLAKGIASTFISQLILVSLLYLVGLGLGTLLSGYNKLGTFGQYDWIWAFSLGLFGAVAGLIISRLEHQVKQSANEANSKPETPFPDFPIRILKAPITPETFFHSQTSEDDPAGLSDAEITAVETRLGIKLPDGLRALYRHQNGGYLSVMCITPPDKTPPFGIDDLLHPFSGYNDLHACTELKTVWEGFLDFADPDDKENYGHLFENGTDKMVLLAQWYQESLFLDYNQAGAPRVGYVDFDRQNWIEHTKWWPSFEAFFAALRLYEDMD